MEFRLTLQKFAENGSHGFPRVSRHGHRGGQVGHGRKWQKWQKMDFRGYLVGNGFSRVLRHFPTNNSIKMEWNSKKGNESIQTINSIG